MEAEAGKQLMIESAKYSTLEKELQNKVAQMKALEEKNKQAGVAADQVRTDLQAQFEEIRASKMAEKEALKQALTDKDYEIDSLK